MGLVLAAARKIPVRGCPWTRMEMHTSLERPAAIISCVNPFQSTLNGSSDAFVAVLETNSNSLCLLKALCEEATTRIRNNYRLNGKSLYASAYE